MSKAFFNGIYALAALLVLALLAFKVFQPIQVLPRMRLAPAYNFTDQDNQPLTSETQRGRFTLYSFTYTHCPPPCYNSNETIREIQSRLDEVELNGIAVSFVTISIDPERDTPDVLKTYGESFGADFAQWKFATTTNRELLKTVVGAGFETYYEDKGGGNFALDPGLVLVDGWGVIRSEYRYVTEVSDADRILRHLGVLAEEAHNSTGSAKLAYEAAHLFLCYAP
ncbi:MAG: SCO family protein [Chloroflexi bacterium]|jgi:protein SCO1/2|nr:SCO family protein [Chloroflexota bacterium]